MRLFDQGREVGRWLTALLEAGRPASLLPLLDPSLLPSLSLGSSLPPLLRQQGELLLLCESSPPHIFGNTGPCNFFGNTGPRTLHIIRALLYGVPVYGQLVINST